MKVPFSPYFLQQLEAGKVKSITSKSGTIDGTFTAKLHYPPNDAKATPTTLFATQVPSFWNSNQLTELLTVPERPGQREEPQSGDLAARASCCVGFGPTLLLFGVSSTSSRGAR